MKEIIENRELAKILVDLFYYRMISHFDLRDYEKEAIEKNSSENTGWKNFYDICLDNVADWGFREAAIEWKKLEKKLQGEYQINIYHDERTHHNGWYTWQRHKTIKFNNDTIKVTLGSKMMEPRHPKEVSNTVYFTVNSKELWDLIREEFLNKKKQLSDKNHTIKIGDQTYMTEDISKSIKSNPKLIVNLIEDILKEIPCNKNWDNYHEVMKPIVKKVLSNFVKYYEDNDDSVTGHLAKALYTKVGGDGWDW